MKSLKHNMGRVEVQDYVSTVEYLVNQGLTDPDRYSVCVFFVFSNLFTADHFTSFVWKHIK